MIIMMTPISTTVLILTIKAKTNTTAMPRIILTVKVTMIMKMINNNYFHNS